MGSRWACRVCYSTLTIFHHGACTSKWPNKYCHKCHSAYSACRLNQCWSGSWWCGGRSGSGGHAFWRRTTSLKVAPKGIQQQRLLACQPLGSCKGTYTIHTLQMLSHASRSSNLEALRQVLTSRSTRSIQSISAGTAGTAISIEKLQCQYNAYRC